MAPEGGLARSKVFDNRLTSNDVFEVLPNPGAGYGDPVLRTPELVADDVLQGKVTRADAERIYGVVLDDSGGVDAATEERRRDLLAQRLADARPPHEPRSGSLSDVGGRALATVAYGTGAEGDDALGCVACGRELAPFTGNYRLGTSWLEIPMTQLGTHFIDPLEQVGADLVWRAYL
jgi:N-methylhydantoinase B